MLPVEPLGLPPVVCLHIPQLMFKTGKQKEKQTKQGGTEKSFNDEGSIIVFLQGSRFLKKTVKKHIGTLLQS